MPRIPKNYQGNRLTVRKLGPLLSTMMKGLGPSEEASLNSLEEMWPDIIGPEMASMTRILRLVQSVLFVEVKSATLYALLARREKPRILGAIKNKLPRLNVQDVSFKLGSTN